MTRNNKMKSLNHAEREPGDSIVDLDKVFQENEDGNYKTAKYQCILFVMLFL